MRELLETLGAWQADGVEVGRAVVVRAYGSAPRQPGAVAVYSSDGRLAGSVSGGCVESDVARLIDEARVSGKSRTVRYGISDEQAYGIGLACGGTIDVLIEPSVPREAVDAAASSDTSALITPLPSEEGSDPQPRLTFDRDQGLTGSTGDAQIDAALRFAANEALVHGTTRVLEIDGRAFLVEVFARPPRLVIVGAVEIARTLVKLAHALGFETIVVDTRPAFASRDRFPDADQILIAWPDEAADQIDLSRDDSVAILAHDRKLDEPAIKDALLRGCRYVGAIGSKKTQADRRERLRELGVSEEDIARLHGPIGLDLGGQAPAETALAVMAEVVATRYAASGESLRDRARTLQVAG